MKFISILSSLFVVTTCLADERKWTLQVEAGNSWTNRNDVRVPGDSGTRLSLKTLTGQGPFNFQRWEATYRQSEDTEWRFLYAPLQVSGAGILPGAVNFQGTSFSPGAASAFYQFNSYRITYRRKWKKTDRSDWMFGYTLKIRDAEVRLSQGATSAAEKDPRGIVPLLNIAGREQINDKWYATFDFDGLAGGPGRAFDIGMRMHYNFAPDSSVFLGYRTLEGGADVPRVYSFAWINYLSLGITKKF